MTAWAPDIVDRYAEALECYGIYSDNATEGPDEKRLWAIVDKVKAVKVYPYELPDFLRYWHWKWWRKR